MGLGHLLHLAREQVQDIRNKVNQQIDLISDEVQSKLQNYVAEVVGGIWRGEGADEFVREITEYALPKLAEITGDIQHQIVCLDRSVSTMDDADARAKSEVNRLADAFERI
ncbi:MAG: hypothetical protein JXA10_10735 [Anaerolineae bacterium]|nr:hypothetical protein [Anaerolineae bacterium]